MRVVFVAGPYSGTPEDIQRNLAATEALCREVALLGAVPVSINILGRFMQDAGDYEWWIAAAKAVIDKSDAVVFAPGWRESSGCRREASYADTVLTPWFTSKEELREWLVNSEKP